MTTPDDLTSTRTHAHRVTEASFIVGNEAAILGALEGRDREIEALRARVGWEVAERNREAGARNVATGVDLDAIEARLTAASDAYYEQLAPRCSYRSAGDGMACGLMSGHDGPHTMLIPPSNGWGLVADTTKDLRALLSEVRRLTDANAHLERLAAAWKLTAEQTEDEARAALATARVDGARAMREAALVECRKVSATSDARGAVGGTQRETDRADGARACWSRVETLDPAAVVGSAPTTERHPCTACPNFVPTNGAGNGWACRAIDHSAEWIDCTTGAANGRMTDGHEVPIPQDARTCPAFGKPAVVVGSGS